jgi:hypothetical protein
MISLLISALLAFQQGSYTDINIYVKLSGVKDGTKVYISTSDRRKDSTYFQHNEAIFHIYKRTEDPELVVIFNRNNSVNIVTYLENSDVSIDGKLEDSPNTYSYSGSKTQLEYLQLNSLTENVQNELKRCYSELSKAESGRDKRIIGEKIESLNKSFVEQEIEFTRKNPASYLGPTLILGILNMNKISKSEAQAWFSLLSPELQKGNRGIKILTIIKK